MPHATGLLNSRTAGYLRKAPALVLKPFSLVPLRIQRPVIEFALREFFSEILGTEALSPFESRWIRLCITDVNLSWVIGVIDGQPFLSTTENAPDLTISGNLEEMVLLASQREDPDTQFFQRRITIEGDTELGLEIKNLIYSLDPERLPEPVKHLLRLLGDTTEYLRSV